MLRKLLLPLLVLALMPAQAVAQPRIVGGHDAPAGVYDAVANISFLAFACSGTLISAQWVMTAGHCGSITGEAAGSPLDWPASSYTITLGTTEQSGAGGEDYSVDKLVHPPQYLATGGYDLTLMHLTVAASQAPIKVAGKGAESLWRPGVMETIVGFGATDESGTTPKTLQVAQVPIVDDATCAAAYPNDPSSPVYPSYFEPVSQICAGYPQGGTDTCQGDSGGPMFGHDALGNPKVVGATSYGNGCAEAGYPGVYARVADTALREWIRSVVPDAIDDAVILTPGATPLPNPSPAPSPSATPPPSTTPTPSQPTPATTPAGRYSIAVRATRRKSLTRGVRVNVTCPGQCSVKLTLVLDAKSKRRLKLRSKTLGKTALAVPPRVRGTATIKPSPSAARKVAHYRRSKLTVIAEFLGAAGERTTVRERARLK